MQRSSRSFNMKDRTPPLAPSGGGEKCETTKWAASWQNQQNGMCAQRRLRSAWASAQSDQHFRCPHEETLGQLPIERIAKTLIRLGGCRGWSESSLGAQSFCWFCHETAQIWTCKCTSSKLTMIAWRRHIGNTCGKRLDLSQEIISHLNSRKVQTVN